MRGRINFKPPATPKGGGKFEPFFRADFERILRLRFARPLKF